MLEKFSRLEDLSRKTASLPGEIPLQDQIEQQRIVFLNFEDHGCRLGIEQMDPLFFSLAVVLASRLIFGTVLTLGVVPVNYAVLFRIRVRG